MMSLLTKASFFVMAATNSNGWTIDNFLKNLNGRLNTWGGLIVTVLGVVMLIVGIFNIAKGMMGGGRGQVNWVLNIALIVVGGALAFSGGWQLLTDISKGTGQSLNDLGTSSNAGNAGNPTSMINNLRMWL